MTIGLVQPGTRRGTFPQMIGWKNQRVLDMSSDDSRHLVAVDIDDRVNHPDPGHELVLLLK
jgi:hypothetical protein